MEDRRQVSRKRGQNVCKIYQINEGSIVNLIYFIKLGKEYGIKFLETSAKDNIVSLIVNISYEFHTLSSL
jgi:hypothetical protein